MSTVTVQGLVDEVRVMSGLRNNQYYTDAQIASFIDDASKELYDKFVLSNQHYFIKMFQFTLTGNSDSRVALPDDFMKENILVKNPGPTEEYIDFLDNYQNTAQQGSPIVPAVGGQRAFISGDYLNIYPAQAAAGDYELRYTPTTETLSLGVFQTLEITQDYDVRLMTDQVLDPFHSGGTWFIDDENHMHAEFSSVARALHIDGELLQIGDKIFVTDFCAVDDPINMGIWEFVGFAGSSGTLTYNFERPVGLQFPDDIIIAHKIVYVSEGALFRQTYWSVDSGLNIAVTSSTVTALNRIDSGFHFNTLFLYNADGPSISMASSVTFQNSIVGDGTYDIVSYDPSYDESMIQLEYLDVSLPSVAIGNYTELSINLTGSRSTIPQTLVSWVLYLKVHASIAVREGRQQDCNDLQVKLAKQEERIAKISQNRTDRVVQAPITRSRWNGGMGGNGF